MAIAIIPARMESTRLPGKPLLRAGGKSLVQHTYEQATRASLINQVVVATDSSEIVNECNRFGGDVFLDNSQRYKCGTERIAACATNRNYDSRELIVNWQVDEPLIDIKKIDRWLDSFSAYGSNCYQQSNTVGTLIANTTHYASIHQDLVKVVTDALGKALWFSRQSISTTGHIGIYAFENQTLQNLSVMKQTEHAKAESLEQLTWLHHHIPVQCYNYDDRLPISINNSEDLAALKGRIGW